MAVLVNGNEIVLAGTVGDPSGWGAYDDTFSASDVIVALAKIGNTNDVLIRLNSGGGVATEGSAIHSAISRHAGKKTVLIEGIAASAGSIIAMAGDEVVMAAGAIMMVHDPAGITVGTIDEHEKQIASLTAVANAMASIYAAKAGSTEADARAVMRAETWMTADQAVAMGYADRVEGAANDDEPEPAAFNYRLYAHAPDRIVALAAAKHWGDPKSRTASAVTDRQPEKTMSNTNTADASSAPTEAQIQERIDAAVATATASTLSRTDASQIAKLCSEGGVPAMASALIAEGATLDQARGRINAAGQIKDVVALARSSNSSIPDDFEATMLAEGKTVEQVRAALFDKMVAKDQDTPVIAHHRAGTGGTHHGSSAGDAVARMKASMQAEIKRNPQLMKGA